MEELDPELVIDEPAPEPAKLLAITSGGAGVGFAAHPPINPEMNKPINN